MIFSVIECLNHVFNCVIYVFEPKHFFVYFYQHCVCLNCEKSIYETIKRLVLTWLDGFESNSIFHVLTCVVIYVTWSDASLHGVTTLSKIILTNWSNIRYANSSSIPVSGTHSSGPWQVMWVQPGALRGHSYSLCRKMLECAAVSIGGDEPSCRKRWICLLSPTECCVTSRVTVTLLPLKTVLNGVKYSLSKDSFHSGAIQ